MKPWISVIRTGSCKENQDIPATARVMAIERMTISTLRRFPVDDYELTDRLSQSSFQHQTFDVLGGSEWPVVRIHLF